MKRNRLIALILAFVLVAPSLVRAQDKVGTTGVQFLKISPTARGVGLADAMLPIANDASTLWYNPAGMTNLKHRELVLSHTNYPAGIAYDYIGMVQPLLGAGAAFGVQVYGLFTDEMDETTPEHPYGTGRTFTASDMAAGVSYAQKLTKKFAVGGTVKYIQENLADEVARGWGVDVGTYYDTNWKSLRIAMLISNFGPDMDFINSPFPLPMVFKFGVAANLVEKANNRLTLTFEGDHPNDNREVYMYGFEYAFKETVFLRFGHKTNGMKRATMEEFADDPEGENPFLEYPLITEEGSFNFDALTFGGGLKIPGIGLNVDYAYSKIAFFGSLHRFTLGYTFR